MFYKAIEYIYRYTYINRRFIKSTSFRCIELC